MATKPIEEMTLEELRTALLKEKVRAVKSKKEPPPSLPRNFAERQALIEKGSLPMPINRIFRTERDGRGVVGKDPGSRIVGRVRNAKGYAYKLADGRVIAHLYEEAEK